MRNKKLLLALSVSLATCNHAQAESNEIYSRYLACYALHPADKQECVGALAQKYLTKEQQQDKTYTEEFQFESEKLGFRNFINNQDLPCDSINDSPMFVEENQAYLVKCKPNHQYFIQFNYSTKEWKLIEENKQ